MKNYQLKSFFLILSLGILVSCVRTTEDLNKTADLEDQAAIYADIDVRNFTETSINITLSDDAGNAISGVKVQLWDGAPLAGGQVIFKAITNGDGVINAPYNLANHLDFVILETGYLGLPSFLKIPVDELDAVQIQGFSTNYEPLDESLIPGQSTDGDESSRMSSNARTLAASYEYLSDYDASGKPLVMEGRDQISTTLLDFVNASLIEGMPVPTYHPGYLADDTETSLNIQEQANVYMTFITEGAGYKNALGFYTYPTDNPPATPEDIETIYIALPNASLQGYGGSIVPGDKIHLGVFEPGVSIGFVLVANGWNGTDVGNGIVKHYSDNNLNTHEDADLMQHTVLLWDDVNELFLIGFEDKFRSKGSDNDFNDAVFYITSDPIEAISRENVKPVDKPEDSDEDGVNDTYDEFPNDPRYAYEYSYPGENSYGTFAFEDQWPNFGDYDFNDVVVDYKYNQRANATNNMVLLQSEFVLKATGAGFDNGFGIELDMNPTQIESVTGNKIFADFLTFNDNGTESNQSKAVIIATDNAHGCFGSNGLINTTIGASYYTPDTISVNVSFANPVALNAAGSAPFNPFIIIDQNRGRELHLPGYKPTDLVDANYFGQVNDGSDPANGGYYKSQKGLPWGMNLPISFDYPEEKTDIRDGYNHFDQWAISGGYSYMDWYTDQAGYRNADKLYTK